MEGVKRQEMASEALVAISERTSLAFSGILSHLVFPSFFAFLDLPAMNKERERSSTD